MKQILLGQDQPGRGLAAGDRVDHRERLHQAGFLPAKPPRGGKTEQPGGAQLFKVRERKSSGAIMPRRRHREFAAEFRPSRNG